MFDCCKKIKLNSSAENVALIKAKAKKLGVDDKSLTTSMGGIETQHYELYKRVLEVESLKYSKNGSRWAFISAIAAIAAVASLFK